MIIYIGYFYIFLGIIFLLIPLIYIELGRPKDFIRAGLNLIIGIMLIIKNIVFENSYPAIYFLFTTLVVFYGVEISFFRWNQLTDKEKIKLTTIVQFKKNISKISEAIRLGASAFINFLKNFQIDRNKENINKKKWERKDKNDNIEA